jgi:hypothetical protein
VILSKAVADLYHKLDEDIGENHEENGEEDEKGIVSYLVPEVVNYLEHKNLI